MAKSECSRGKRCHVQGKDLKTWGKTIPRAVVLEAASSSVQLVVGGKRVASGTLVWNNVVLSAYHPFATQTATDFEVLLAYEYDSSTAPGGHAEDHYKNPLAFLTGTPLATTPQAKVVEMLEQDLTLDFAFLRIEWKSVTTRVPGFRPYRCRESLSFQSRAPS